MKTSGIILELNRRRAIVMTKGAGFKTIKPLPGMFVGQQVDMEEPSLKKNPFLFASYSYLPGFASIVFFFFIGLAVITFSAQNKVFGFVSVDINPSVEFAINKDIRIIRVKGLNHDGKVLLRGVDFKNIPFDKALLILVGKAEQHQYFHNKDTHYVFIAAAVKSESKKRRLTNVRFLNQSIRRAEEKLKKSSIHLQFVQATLAQREAAIQKKMSIGRYLLSNIAAHHGQAITLDQAQAVAIPFLLKKAGLIGESKTAAVVIHGNSRNKATILKPKNKTSIDSPNKTLLKKNNIQDNELISQKKNSPNNAEENAENDQEKDKPDSKLNSGKGDFTSQGNGSTGKDKKDAENESDPEASNSKAKDNQSNSGNSSNNISNSNHSNSGSTSSGNSSLSSKGSNSRSGGSGTSGHSNSSKK